MAVIISLYQLNYVGIENFKNDSIRSKYNAFITNINYQSMIFIKHHYMCDRIDTPFWKDMHESTLPEELYNIRKNLQTIQSNSDLMDIIGLESSFLNHLDKFCIFNYKNYKMVDNGHKIKTKKTLF